MKRIALALALCLSIAACGGNSPSPAAPTPTPTPAPILPPTPVTFTLSGRITAAANGSGVSGAAVRILDGPNAAKTTNADGSGSYSLPGLTSSGFTISIVADSFAVTTRPVNLIANVTVNAALLPASLFAQQGIGDTVFTIPSFVTRIRVQADYGGNSSNFIVHIAGRGVVNELVGRAWNQTHFDGTYVTTGGVTEILSSSGVSWSFVEQR